MACCSCLDSRKGKINWIGKGKRAHHISEIVSQWEGWVTNLRLENARLAVSAAGGVARLTAAAPGRPQPPAPFAPASAGPPGSWLSYPRPHLCRWWGLSPKRAHRRRLPLYA